MIAVMEALQAAISIFDTQVALAKAIGRSQQNVNNWLRRGRVPADICPAIERVTEGRITCEMLRADIDWSYLRTRAA